MTNKLYLNHKNSSKKIFLILIIVNVLTANLIDKFCQKCINKNYKECKFCSRELIFKGLKIASREETLNEIINNHKSIARFGDGEFLIIFGKRNAFQKMNKIIKTRLYKILNST